MSNADWMQQHLDVIHNYTINDLCLPGTHDTLTYDLIPKISENDVIPFIRGGARELEWYNKRLLTLAPASASKLASAPTEPTPPTAPTKEETAKLLPEWMVNSAKSQCLNIQEQFTAGMRMFDIKMTFSRGRWIGTHALETRLTIDVYLKALVEVMQKHKGEVCVVWISTHGLSGLETGSKLSKVPNAHVGWQIARDAMSPLLVDNVTMPFDTTTVGTLVRANKRIYAFVDGYIDVTWKDRFAVSSKLVRNVTFTSLNASDLTSNRANLLKAINNPTNATNYTGVGLNNSLDLRVYIPVGIRYLFQRGNFLNYLSDGQKNIWPVPLDPALSRASNNSSPLTLAGFAQLTLYYLQSAMHAVVSTKTPLEPPNVVSTDVVLPDGCVRVGWDPISQSLPQGHLVGGQISFPFFDFVLFLMFRRLAGRELDQAKVNKLKGLASSRAERINVSLVEVPCASRFIDVPTTAPRHVPTTAPRLNPSTGARYGYVMPGSGGQRGISHVGQRRDSADTISDCSIL